MRYPRTLAIRGVTVSDGTGHAPFVSRHRVIASGRAVEVGAAVARRGRGHRRRRRA